MNDGQDIYITYHYYMINTKLIYIKCQIRGQCLKPTDWVVP